MAATVISFRWLDLLEKEFDKSFIDLDFILGDIEFEDNEEIGLQAKQKMHALSSCFAQLAHKAQTIFQINAKLEAEIVNLKQDLAESRASCQVIQSENEEILLKLHSAQIQLQKQNTQSEMLDIKYLDSIHKKIVDDITSRRQSLLGNQTKKEELALLKKENDHLKKEVISLQGDVCGAKLTTKYLDKELSGRIQQLQLLSNRIEGDQHHHLWKQLESEIQLQRHKTIVRACRKNILTSMDTMAPEAEEASVLRPNKSNLHRFVHIKRKGNEELGITITGGIDHGIPVLISALNYKTIAGLTDQIFVGDAILSVNGICLRDATQTKAAAILSSQKGSITLELVFIPSDEETENDLLPDDDDITNRYKIFDDDVLSFSSSLQLVQNGRLSRASIESIRGSTENILDVVSNGSETGNYAESLCTNNEKESPSLETKYDNESDSCENELNSVQNHILFRKEILNYEVQNLNQPNTPSIQNLDVRLNCDTTFDDRSHKNLQASELLFNCEF